MPVERVPTPRPVPRNISRIVEYYDKAKKFIETVTNFLTKTKEIYKFFLFAYMTLMILFVFVVDSKTYNFKQMGTEVFGLIILIELALGTACILAVLGLVHRRTSLIAPLLFLQIFVLIYGLAHYLCPFMILIQKDAMIQADLESNGQLTFSVIAKIIMYVLLRMTPLFVQLLFIALTVKTIFCLMIIQKIESQQFLPIRTTSTTNSHIWSSIRRKISSRNPPQILNQAQARSLPSPDLIYEMSAKFRSTKYPQPKLQSLENCQ